MFLTSRLGGIDSTRPANAGLTHAGGPQQVLCAATVFAGLLLRHARHVAEAPVNGEPACQETTSVSPLSSSNEHGQDGGGGGAGQLGLPAKNALFPLMTFMLKSSQRVVRRPAQIMLMVFAGETITLKVNWWATHSGGPMHFARLPFPLAGSVTQAWQAAEAVSGIVLASKSCGHSVAGVKTGLSSREDLASRAYSGERGPAAHSHTEPHRRSRTAMLAFDRSQCRTSNR